MKRERYRQSSYVARPDPPPRLPVIGQCEAVAAHQDHRCPNPARHEVDGRKLCGVHYRPIMLHREMVERESVRYRDHHVGVYADQLYRHSDDEVLRILENHRLGTIPESATVLERLRLEARRLAAERVAIKRGLIPDRVEVPT